MSDALTRALGALARGERLGEELVAAAFAVLMSGAAPPARAAALLMGLRVQGETGPELAGAARALRAVMRRVDLPGTSQAVDTCGTGGGTVATFNVSTAAAFAAAGAGVRIAKHGNRSYTSRCGSADVLEALGIDLTEAAARPAAVFQQAGIVFLFAPAFHPAMRHVAPVRRDLAVPTIMNLVGPLANPAAVQRQVVGVADADRAPVVADALARLGAHHALVVHGAVGMDEIAPTGLTQVWEIRDGRAASWSIDPARHGLEQRDLAALQGGEPAQNARRIERLLADPGRDPAARSATVLNAGAAIYVAGLAPTVADGFALAGTALEDGRAAAALAALRAAAGLRTSG